MQWMNWRQLLRSNRPSRTKSSLPSACYNDDWDFLRQQRITFGAFYETFPAGIRGFWESELSRRPRNSLEVNDRGRENASIFYWQQMRVQLLLKVGSRGFWYCHNKTHSIFMSFIQLSLKGKIFVSGLGQGLTFVVLLSVGSAHSRNIWGDLPISGGRLVKRVLMQTPQFRPMSFSPLLPPLVALKIGKVTMHRSQTPFPQWKRKREKKPAFLLWICVKSVPSTYIRSRLVSTFPRCVTFINKHGVVLVRPVCVWLKPCSGTPYFTIWNPILSNHKLSNKPSGLSEYHE